MADAGQNDANSTWIREQLDAAVQLIMSRGIIDEKLAEARPIWSLPEKFLLGQVRVAKQQDTYIWIIAGDCPTDCIPHSAAATPRDAVRHFALKWQLDATRQADAETTELLAAKAEELYAIAEEDHLWKAADDS